MADYERIAPGNIIELPVSGPVIYENQDELDRALAYWQKTMRLQDWEIKAKIARKRDLPLDNAGATITRVECKKQALIQIMDPTDWDVPDFEQDHEIDLVHELMHCHEGDVMDEVYDADKSLYERLYTQRERLVHLVATALVALNRK